MLVAPIILLVTKGLSLTKDNASFVNEILYFLAIWLYISAAFIEFFPLYLFKFGNKSSLLFFGILLSKYFPVKTPKASGE